MEQPTFLCRYCPFCQLNSFKKKPSCR